MNTLTKLVLIAALILSVLIPFGYFLLGQKKKSRYKKALGVNVFFFFGTLLIAAVVMLYEDSSIFGKSLIFAGLAEGICLYGLVIAFMILGKL